MGLRLCHRCSKALTGPDPNFCPECCKAIAAEERGKTTSPALDMTIQARDEAQTRHDEAQALAGGEGE